MNKSKYFFLVGCTLVGFAIFFTTKSFQLHRIPAQEMDQNKTLSFLDKRTANWLTTSISNQHDSGTRCLSCHTTLSYSIIRPEYGETNELRVIKNLIEERINDFEINGIDNAWYRQFSEGSLTTETIINAVSLISMDMAKDNNISPLTEKSLKQLWQRQISTGAKVGGFEWLEGFGLEPLESRNAGYWGSALIASSINDIPGYTNRENVKDNVENLKKYLSQNFDQQSLHNKLMAIETNNKFGGTIIPAQKVRETLNEVLRLAETSGGWDLHRLLGRSGVGIADSYATSIVLKAFLTLGETDHPTFKTGLSWLKKQQVLTPIHVSTISKSTCNDLIGAFLGHSMRHNQASLFMTDLATAFSLKALNMAKKAGL